MKKLSLILAIAVFCSCSSRLDRLNTVKNTFPHAIIISSTTTNCWWLVINNNDTIAVYTGNLFNSEITDIRKATKLQ